MDDLTPTLEAWRVVRLGGREFIDAVVAAEHRGPSAVLTGALGAWPGRYYWAAADRSHLVLIRPLTPARSERWVLHAVLFGLTVVCALGAGAALAGTWVPLEGPGLLGVVSGAAGFFLALFRGDWRDILVGWPFAFPLLAVLLVHELGHYFTARRYAVDASPPYFLPVPPSLSPIGSLGAFLRLRSPIFDRRQLLDIGAAGPLAGFAVTLLVLGWGYATSHPATGAGHVARSFITLAGERIELGDSLLTAACRRLWFPGAAAVELSLPAFAGWVGAFVTGLNLLPLSQLDGGHVLYGLLGRRQATVGLGALVALVVLAQFSWNWYLWVAIVLLIGRGGWSHPPVMAPARAVPAAHRWIGWLAVAVFALTFVPLPFG
jgi:hypothetical protein